MPLACILRIPFPPNPVKINTTFPPTIMTSLIAARLRRRCRHDHDGNISWRIHSPVPLPLFAFRYHCFATTASPAATSASARASDSFDITTTRFSIQRVRSIACISLWCRTLQCPRRSCPTHLRPRWCRFSIIQVIDISLLVANGKPSAGSFLPLPLTTARQY